MNDFLVDLLNVEYEIIDLINNIYYRYYIYV